MLLIRTFCFPVFVTFICFNFSLNIGVNAAPEAQENIATFARTSSAGRSVVMEQQKPLLAPLKADKLDLPADVKSSGDGPVGIDMAPTAHEESLTRQKRQVILPYGGYGRYFGGYPYYYPYSYNYYYRPYSYSYYRPLYSYGYPLYYIG